MSNGLKTLAAFVGGAAIGAATGLLLAPEKGEDQRKKIVQAIKESGAKLNKEEMKKLVDSIMEKIKSFGKSAPESEDEVDAD